MIKIQFKVSSIAMIIGCANWIMVAVIFTLFFTNPKGLPSYALASVLGYYLFYSFVPALVSIVLTFKVSKGYKLVNIAINIIFLWLYIIAYMFSKHMMNA